MGGGASGLISSYGEQARLGGNLVMCFRVRGVGKEKNSGQGCGYLGWGASEGIALDFGDGILTILAVNHKNKHLRH